MVQNFDPSDGDFTARRNSLINNIKDKIGADNETDDASTDQFKFPFGENSSKDLSTSVNRRHTINV